MEIDTEYALKLFFPTSAFVQVYFEAVANAFDAGATEVHIRIQEAPLEVTIHDNGAGFTDDRFERFAKLAPPMDAYHKGLGRLVYLNYFDHVDVESVFDHTEHRTKRKFVFSKAFGGAPQDSAAPPEEARGSTLRFRDFNRVRLQSKSEGLSPAILKERLIEQFLPLLHHKKKQGEPFRITVALDVGAKPGRAHKALFSDEHSITAEDVPSLDHALIEDRLVDLYEPISMYFSVRSGGGGRSLTAVCIDGRAVPIHQQLFSPSAIPQSCSVIFLFESKLFSVDVGRQRLSFPDTIPQVEVLRALRRAMARVLRERLPEIDAINARVREQFEDTYPHLIGLFEDETVGLINKDDAIEVAQRRFLRRQKEVLEGDALDDATFAKSLDVSSRALAEYILYRELILKRLRATVPSDKEAAIHDLIVPRYQRFEGSALAGGVYSNNAWLLDDRFMSFRTILSEATMDEVLTAITAKEGAGEEAGGRPDITLIFSADPREGGYVDVVIVEIKKRGAGEKENLHAPVQLLSRAETLVNHWPTIQRVWYFAVIDVDDALSRRLHQFKWLQLFSRGKVFYQEFPVTRANGDVVLTPIYLLPYEALIEDAAARNHTFLEILRSDFKRVKPR